MTPIRVKADNWRFWITATMVGMVFLFICVLILFAKQQNANQREHDRNQAAKVLAANQMRIANAAQVGSCVTAYRSAPNVLRILDVLDVLASNSIIANTQALAQDPGSPLTKVRRDSLRRLSPSKKTILGFRVATLKDQKTLAQCRTLATKLHVDIRPFLTKKEARQ